MADLQQLLQGQMGPDVMAIGASVFNGVRSATITRALAEKAAPVQVATQMGWRIVTPEPLASGILASSAMNTASFEAMFSVYTRMIPQKTYEAILTTPLEVQDILAGEMLWCATKCVISSTAILIVAAFLGAVHTWHALWVPPVLFLIGLCFSGMGLIMSALAPGYDFFNYYVTLVLTPMFILSGVFYPVTSLPVALQSLVQLLPLAHAVDLIRPLVAGLPLSNVALHLAVLAGYGIVGYLIAVRLTRRRLLV